MYQREYYKKKFYDDKSYHHLDSIDEAKIKKMIYKGYSIEEIAEELDKPLNPYGLRTDFQLNFFEGSEALFKYADVINGVRKTCACGNEAIVNARYDDNGIIYEGDQIVLGSNDKYKALCYTCYKKGRLNGKNRN